MDRGKQPLIMGEWTTVHKKPNKEKAEANSKKGFVPAQQPYYPNQGYYVSYPMVNQPPGSNILNYPMVNQPMGNTFSLTPNKVSQLQWSQNPNSVSQTSYAEVIKGAENLLNQQQIQELKDLSKIKDFYNPGLSPEFYNFINEIWKTHISNQRANFRRALTRFSLFLVEKKNN